MTLSNEQYHADPAVSASHLHAVAKSPYHYWSRYLDPKRSAPEPTAAMRLGSLVHCAVLEPEDLLQRYGVCGPRNTKAGKAAIAKADTLDKLQEVVARMDKRKPDLSDEQNQQLMELALAREAALAPTTEDPFADD